MRFTLNASAPGQWPRMTAAEAELSPNLAAAVGRDEGLFVQPVARGLHAAVDRVVQFYFRID